MTLTAGARVGPYEIVALGGIEPIDANWSSDGRSLFLNGSAPGRARRIFVREGEAGHWRGVTPEGIAGQFVVSPDGHAVALQGSTGVTIYEAAGGERKTYSAARGEPVQWSASGRTIYVRRPGQSAPALIDTLDLATGALQPFRELMPTDPTGVAFVAPVYFARDGRSYAYGYSRQMVELYLIDGVR